MVGWRLAPCVSGLVGVVFSVRPASAGDAVSYAPTLEWQAPPECPQRAEVTLLVEQLLGQPWATERPQRISLSATVEANGSGYGVRIVALTTQGRSERVITHRDCRELADASALVMALAIDPELFQRQAATSSQAPPAPLPSATPPPPASLPPPVMAPASPPPPVIAPSSSRGRPRRWEGTLATVVRLGAGVLSGLDAALGAELGIGQAPWRVVARGSYWWPHQISVRGYEPAQVGARLLSAGAKACLVPQLRSGRLIACLGGELGDVRSEGEHVTGGRVVHRRWAALLTGIGLEWPLGSRLALSPELEAGCAVERHPVHVHLREGKAIGVVKPEFWFASLSLALRVRLD